MSDGKIESVEANAAGIDWMDKIGRLHETDEGFLQWTLREGRKVWVYELAKMGGKAEVWCVNTDGHRWKLNLWWVQALEWKLKRGN